MSVKVQVANCPSMGKNEIYYWLISMDVNIFVHCVLIYFNPGEIVTLYNNSPSRKFRYLLSRHIKAYYNNQSTDVTDLVTDGNYGIIMGLSRVNLGPNSQITDLGLSKLAHVTNLVIERCNNITKVANLAALNYLLISNDKHRVNVIYDTLPKLRYLGLASYSKDVLSPIYVNGSDQLKFIALKNYIIEDEAIEAIRGINHIYFQYCILQCPNLANMANKRIKIAHCTIDMRALAIDNNFNISSCYDLDYTRILDKLN
jgi:hypothetical protein